MAVSCQRHAILRHRFVAFENEVGLYVRMLLAGHAVAFACDLAIVVFHGGGSADHFSAAGGVVADSYEIHGGICLSSGFCWYPRAAATRAAGYRGKKLIAVTGCGTRRTIVGVSCRDAALPLGQPAKPWSLSRGFVGANPSALCYGGTSWLLGSRYSYAIDNSLGDHCADAALAFTCYVPCANAIDELHCHRYTRVWKHGRRCRPANP